MTIRCIAFDLDDTLWECHSVIDRAERYLYQQLQRYCPSITQYYSYEAFIQSRGYFSQAHPELKYNMTQMRLNWLRELLNEHGYPTEPLAQQLFHTFWLERNKVSLFPNVLEQLAALRLHYPLGVITNGNADVHHIGIGYLFNFTLSSAEASAAKPDSSIFRQALALANVEAHEMVYVGDDPERDIRGASEAGLRTIWFNPQGHAGLTGLNPDAVMTNFAELTQLIKVL
ncbi:MAG: haloacid dehalogenase [Proteobacteria bacterium]|nr:MAG: haloacid dehalogenase [Pseudomonadota bacterium]